ncbi:MAG: glycosyltransferase family 2 protein [Gammaproteobacteria bacterium]|nr:glycosyltransferase family 2 protein [Gammaproteobacteria bacterium]MCP5196491.1 glycosyltransferase family 2 protein [Gammaproteobacteria bacterium]
MNDHMACSYVSIVIPFFQREKGLLERSVLSILSQRDFNDYRIIVVDDGSPVSAEEELASIIRSTKKITIIQQENAGPGAARNKGLDSILDGTKYVAFMDSDDWWEETFLSDAVFALNKGHDLFFGNSKRFGVEKTRFEWNSSSELNLNPSEHMVLNSERELYEFKGDFFDFMIFRSNIISTSAMIYKYEKYSYLRFNIKLFNGQDRLFKLSLCKNIEKVAFSAKICTYEEKGVNIFDSANWGSAKSLVLLSNYIKLPKYILKEISLNKNQEKFIISQLNASRYSFAASILHLLRNGNKIDWNLVVNTFKEDIGTAIYFLPNIVKILIKKYFY